MAAPQRPQPDARVEGADLGVGTGLLMLLRAHLDPATPGTVLAIRTSDGAARHDLPAWCRLMAHDYLGAESDGGSTIHYLRKGEVRSHAFDQSPDWGVRMPLRDGKQLHARDWMIGRAGAVPNVAATTTGFAPRGAVVEAGSPAFDFTINRRESVWAAQVADLYEQATAAQWDGARDIPWHQLKPLPEPLERAVCQLMTFLTENEYSALYVPAKFVPRINPQFNEVVLFLATQMMDEARHIEVFTKRALANGGGLQYSAASTQTSLKTLFDQHDFTIASFLLSVLGEGTFLDLLKFIETHAPDPVTAEISRRAREDETRHVHFGMAHMRYYLEDDPRRYDELRSAVRQRAAVMSAVTEVSPRVQDALAVLAAGGMDPARLPDGIRKVRTLIDEMHVHRLQRLQSGGFTAEQAEEMSRFHTPNFM